MATLSPLYSTVPTTEELQAAHLPAPVDLRAQYIAMIDRDVDLLYGKVIGNRGPEYTLAESDAQSFAARSYAAPVPATVQVWASVKGWTAQQAADNIIAQSSLWRTAQIAIRQQRLVSKEALRVAQGDQALHQAMKSWKRAFGQLKSSLGV